MPSARVTAPPVTATNFPSHSSQPKTNGLADPKAAVDGFLALVTNYCADGGYEKLKSLLEDHEALKKTLNDKGIANKENLESIASLTQDVKNNEQQLSRSKHEVEALKRELKDVKADNHEKSGQLEQSRTDMSQLVKKCKDKEAEIQRHQNSISELKKSTKEHAQEVETLKANLEAEKKSLSAQHDNIQALKGSLEQLESFSIQMVDCTAIQATVNATLGSLFEAAYKLMESFLFQDVDQDILKKFSLGTVSTKIPLPASNTLPARQMRLAVGLEILGRTLARHIFQPLYISEDEDWLTASMGAVMEDNPDLETHARGVVLNLLDHNTLVAKGEARAKKAAMEVSRVVKKFIPAEMGTSFDKDLQHLCDQALETWLPLQRVADRVMVELSYPELGEEWKELQMPPRTTTGNGNINGSSSGKQPKNTSRHSSSSPSSQPGPRGQRGSASGGSSQGQSSTPRPGSSNPGGPVYEVWPAFIVNDDDVTLLHHGLVLTEEQVKEAREEVAKGEAGRRENRTRARRNADANRRRDSTSFLARGGGGNSPVD